MDALTPVHFLADTPAVVGPIVINPNGGEVLIEGALCRLEPAWRMLLNVLSGEPNKFFSETQLSQALQPLSKGRFAYPPASIKDIIARLRSALNRTYPGAGYLIRGTGTKNKGTSLAGKDPSSIFYKIIDPLHKGSVIFGPFVVDLMTGRVTKRVIGGQPVEVTLRNLERESFFSP